MTIARNVKVPQGKFELPLWSSDIGTLQAYKVFTVLWGWSTHLRGSWDKRVIMGHSQLTLLVTGESGDSKSIRNGIKYLVDNGYVSIEGVDGNRRTVYRIIHRGYGNKSKEFYQKHWPGIQDYSEFYSEYVKENGGLIDDVHLPENLYKFSFCHRLYTTIDFWSGLFSEFETPVVQAAVYDFSNKVKSGYAITSPTGLLRNICEHLDRGCSPTGECNLHDILCLTFDLTSEDMGDSLQSDLDTILGR